MQKIWFGDKKSNTSVFTDIEQYVPDVKYYQMYHIEQNSGKQLHMFSHDRRRELSKD